jgi:quinol monooxygenase YgiN
VAGTSGDLYGLVVRFELLAGHEAPFDELAAQTLERIAAEEVGTLAYVSHVDAESVSVRVFYELYRDRAAFEAHEATPHVRHFLAERAQHLRTDPQVWFVSPVFGLVREGIDLSGA